VGKQFSKPLFTETQGYFPTPIRRKSVPNKSRIRPLLDLIHQKRQHHERRENDRQVLLAMPEVVLEMIALVLERVVRLVFNLPSSTARAAGTS
jgi:hypothetical protein